MQRGTGPLLAGLASAVLVVALGAVAMDHLGGTSTASPTSTTATSTTLQVATTTLAPATTTTTTIDVGALPQTAALPRALSRALTGRMKTLVAAVAAGEPALAHPAFFPKGAYVQTKSGWGNAADWQYRLIGHFDEDVMALHRQLGAHASQATFAGYAVDVAHATWVLANEEGNKGPYWRVYNSTVAYKIGGQRGSFNITTMISWRGEWYVVHLTGFNS